MTASPPDYYKVLGLAKTASAEEIKKAYRRFARKYHPDLHPGAQKAEMERKFKELNEAYEVLSDDEKRKKYDQFGHQWKEAEAYQRARQQTVAQPGGREWHTVFTSGEEGDFSGVFENIFGRQATKEGASFRGFAMPGADLEATASLTLREVVTGTTRRLQLGDVVGKPQTLDVRIPKGVLDGERVKVKGKGAPGRGGGPPGDLYLRVHITPHPVFQRKGANLFVTLPVWPWEAVLGTEVQVPTLTGSVRLKIPPGSQAQQKMRLKGKGLPNRSGGQGDQVVILEIVVPTSLTDQERELYEQCKTVEHPDPRLNLLREGTHG